MKLKFVRSGALLLMLSLCVPFPATSGTLSTINLRMGPAELYPRFIYEEAYTSNIYNAEADEQDAFRSRFTFGSGAKLQLGDHQFFATYRGVRHHVNGLDEFNRIDHSADASLRLNFASGLTVVLKHEFGAKSIEPNFPADRRNDYLQHISTAGISFPVTEKFGFDAAYAYHDKSYEDPLDAVDDYTKDQITGRFTYNYSVKTAIFAEYGLFIVDNAFAATDNRKHNVMGGVRLDVTDKVTGIVKAGFTTVRFVNGKRPTDFGARADLVFQIRPTTLLHFMLQREIEETTLSGENSLNGDFFKYTAAAMELSQKMGHKLMASVSGSYSHSNFPEGLDVVLREDDFYHVEARLAYSIQPWLQLVGGGNRAENQSNIFINDFKASKAFAFLKFAVDP